MEIEYPTPQASGLKPKAFYNSSASSVSSMVNSPRHSVHSVVEIENRKLEIENPSPQASQLDRRFINELTKESGLSEDQICSLPAESLVTLSNAIELCRLEKFDEERKSKELLTGPKETYKDLIVTLHTCLNTDSKYNLWHDINPVRSFLRRQALKNSKLKTNNLKLSSASSVSSVVSSPFLRALHDEFEKTNPKLYDYATVFAQVPDT